MAEQIIAYAGSPLAQALDNPNTPIGLPIANSDGRSPLASFSEVPTDWFPLRPCSWRGVPFVMEGGDVEIGRRVALHQYPFRDTPYPEDLGRKAEPLSVIGFIVGTNLIARRAQLVQALRAKGVGELAHSTFGRIQLQLLACKISESKEHGGCFRLDFSFIEKGDVRYPTTASDTQAATRAAAANAQATVSGDFVSRIGAALSPITNGISSAYNAAKAAIAPITSFASAAIGVVNRATAAYRLVTGLKASIGSTFGRFAGITNPLQAFRAASGTINGMVSTASSLRAVATSTATSVENLAGRLGV